MCGSNAKVKDQLGAKAAAGGWGPGVVVAVEGFVSNMEDYMAAADCLVTKVAAAGRWEMAGCSRAVAACGRADAPSAQPLLRALSRVFMYRRKGRAGNDRRGHEPWPADDALLLHPGPGLIKRAERVGEGFD